ncbi:MAG: hypothetical protein OXC84_01020 [Gammaproteobacteria bacterium]|nr:hypothetical protein [Gammaproteobacteria bacterium]
MSSQYNRGSGVSFGLSFLDVLCCGLGAAVLLLLIVKHGPAESSVDGEGYLIQQITRIQDQLAARTRELDNLAIAVTESEYKIAEKIAQKQAGSAIQSAQMTYYLDLIKQLNAERQSLKSARSQLFAAQAKKLEDEAEAKKASEVIDSQLTGLLIKDTGVVILLDASASMLSRSIVEIIRLRASNQHIQQNAKKWVTARESAKWVYKKISDGGNYQIFLFNDEVRDIHGRVVNTTSGVSWQNKSANVLPVTDAIDKAMPRGATDLKSVLQVVARMKPEPRQVVLITDGLPTLPGTSSLGRLRDCPSKKRGVTPIVSPVCRLSVYLNAIKVVEKDLVDVPFDVILLPLDGDSNAVYAYWLLSSLSGGRLISPAEGWPNA